jgi:hypothetical protein
MSNFVSELSSMPLSYRLVVVVVRDDDEEETGLLELVGQASSFPEDFDGAPGT